ncbi:MAG TPA: 3-deoxy-manno-octulosonate-8-phosphatase KdsC [Gammaproteobacteria bacterium]|nr:3-deoxy-manno-octulosonate-8-phosphatase KdsC [Gammaproteobacteria bacterium]
MISTTLSAQLLERAADIRLLILDVDGVMTDGRLLMGTDGSEHKTFNVKDGHGIKQLLRHGVEVAVISGRSSLAVDRRMAELGITHYYAGQSNKLPRFEELISELKIEPEQVAYLGDDEPDLPVMERCGLPVAVADAHKSVLAIAGWVTSLGGGQGAVRELTDLIIESRTSRSDSD